MGFSHLPSPVVGRSPAGGAGRAAAGCPRRGHPMQTPAGCRARAGPGAAWHHCLPSTEILPSAPLPSGSLSLPFLTPWLCLLGTSSIRLFAQRGFWVSLRVHRLENTFGNAPFHAPSPAPVPSLPTPGLCWPRAAPSTSPSTSPSTLPAPRCSSELFWTGLRRGMMSAAR